MAWNDLGALGVHRVTKQLYWNGEPLVTEKRFNTFERALAVLGLLIAVVGVGATVVQAWAALQMLPPPV